MKCQEKNKIKTLQYFDKFTETFQIELYLLVMLITTVWNNCKNEYWFYRKNNSYDFYLKSFEFYQVIPIVAVIMPFIPCIAIQKKADEDK